MADLRFARLTVAEETPGWENDVCVVHDIDGDGLEDFIIGAKEGQGNLVWYQAPDWRRHTMATASLEAGGAFVDITGDGRDDFVAGQHADGRELYWFERGEDPTEPWTRRVITREFERYHDQATGDVDGHGRSEIVFASQNARVLGYFDIPDDPRQEPWPLSHRHMISTGEAFEGIAVADLDGDGACEIVAGGNIFRREGEKWARRAFADFHWPVAAVGDLDGDGRPEIVLAEGENDRARLAWFAGPDWKANVLADDLFHPHSLALADFDGDGRLDIMVAEMGLARKSDPSVLVYLNRGGGEFEKVVVETGRPTHCARVIRVKGHGLPSIVGKPYDPGRWVDLWVNVTR